VAAMKTLVALILVTILLWTFFRPIFDLLGTIVGRILGIKFKEESQKDLEIKKDFNEYKR
jgi:hypothetical protein